MTVKEASHMNLSTVVEWAKLVAVALPLVVGLVGGSIKFFERFSAVPELQKDVKTLKRDMRFVVRSVSKLTKEPMPHRQSHEDDGE